MMEIVNPFVGFDWANLFIYSPGREYSRFVCRHGDPVIAYQSRWFPTPEAYRDWVTQPETWIDDLAPYIAREPGGRELLDRPDFKDCHRRGRSWVAGSAGVGRWKDHRGSMSQSKQPGTYNGEARKILERLMLQQALLAVFHAADSAERDFVSDLVREIAGSQDHQQLARTVVNELATFYEFQNVSFSRSTHCVDISSAGASPRTGRRHRDAGGYTRRLIRDCSG